MELLQVVGEASFLQEVVVQVVLAAFLLAQKVALGVEVDLIPFQVVLVAFLQVELEVLVEADLGEVASLSQFQVAVVAFLREELVGQGQVGLEEVLAYPLEEVVVTYY